jgi:hypothetical protein
MTSIIIVFENLSAPCCIVADLAGTGMLTSTDVFFKPQQHLGEHVALWYCGQLHRKRDLTGSDTLLVFVVHSLGDRFRKK